MRNLFIFSAAAFLSLSTAFASGDEGGKDSPLTVKIRKHLSVPDAIRVKGTEETVTVQFQVLDGKVVKTNIESTNPLVQKDVEKQFRKMELPQADGQYRLNVTFKVI